MTEKKIKISALTGRANFVRMNTSASRFVVSNFIMQMEAAPQLADDEIKIGYTVTKKMGGAVVRNRIKRRLREAVREAGAHAKPQRNYVLIARKREEECDFSELVRELGFAFSRIKDK